MALRSGDEYRENARQRVRRFRERHKAAQDSPTATEQKEACAICSSTHNLTAKPVGDLVDGVLVTVCRKCAFLHLPAVSIYNQAVAEALKSNATEVRNS